ncbi:MAG: hypothetical protein ACKO2G_12530 [Verrucomicrobiales bacterium]
MAEPFPPSIFLRPPGGFFNSLARFRRVVQGAGRCGLLAAALLLFPEFRAGAQEAPPPPADGQSPRPGDSALVTPLELPPLDPSGAATGDDPGMLVTSLHMEKMLDELALPESSSGSAEGGPDENPLFASPEEADAATIQRVRAITAMREMNTRVGPFGLTGPFLGLQTGLSFTGLYDSNIFQRSEQYSQETYGQGPESFVLRFTPFARYRTPGPIFFIDAAYGPSYVTHTDYDVLSGWEHNATLALRYDRRKWGAELSGYYRSTINGNSLNDIARQQNPAAIGGIVDNSFDREGLAGEDYGGSFRAGFAGQRFATSFGLGYGLSSGQNRYYDTDVREERIDTDLRITYKLTSKTKLELDGGYAFRGPYSQDIEVEVEPPPPPPPPIYVNTLGQQIPPPPGIAPPEPAPVQGPTTKTVEQDYPETVTARMNFAALWQVSPLLELGPGVRATYDERSDGLASNSFGPILRARYKVSNKISFNAQIGAEFHQFDEKEPEPVIPPPPPPQRQIIVVPDVVTDPNNPVAPAPVAQPVVQAPAPTPEPTADPEPSFTGGASPFITGEIGATWSPTDQWAVNLGVARNASVGSGNGDDFREVFATRGSVTRRFDRSSLTLTGGYQIESPLREQTAGQTSLDREFLTVDLSYSFPIWRDRAFATTFVGYRNDQSGNAENSYDGYRAGLAIGIGF